MIINIEGSSYNIDNILYFNTTYMVMGLYVINIYFKSQKDPLVLEYDNKDDYDKIVKDLQSLLTIN